jgi:hypothetical protein
MYNLLTKSVSTFIHVFNFFIIYSHSSHFDANSNIGHMNEPSYSAQDNN